MVTKKIQPKLHDPALWLKAIAYMDKEEGGWREKSSKVIEAYRDDKNAWQRKRSKFNILWSNVETLKPALYQETPKPDVRRRFRDADPLGKQAAEIIERGLAYHMDLYDFDHVIESAILDYLLVGRAVARVKYKPHFSSDEEKHILDESITIEHVHWQDFRRGPGRYWGEVEWIAFRHYLNHNDFTQQFGEEKTSIAYDYNPFDDESAFSKKQKDKLTSSDSAYRRHIVWEIWDKATKQVIFITPGDIERPLKIIDDPLGLSDFYPIARPLYSFEDANSLIPVPEYWCYKDQADELEKISDRISKIVKAIKARGIYDSRISEFSELMSLDDAELVPAENAAFLMDQGGLDRAVWFLPIEALANVLQVLYTQREQIKQVIYELTGISDILRGTSQTNETATAQNIKAQYGTLRIQKRQKSVQRFSRDLLRLKAELIGSLLSAKTIEVQTGRPVSPKLRDLLKDHKRLGYRVEIETSQTMQHLQQEDQKQMNEALNGLVGLFNALMPALNAGILSQDSTQQLILAILRRFKFGREIENIIESMPFEIK